MIWISIDFVNFVDFVNILSILFIDIAPFGIPQLTNSTNLPNFLTFKTFVLKDHSNHDKDSGQPLPEEKIFKDDELVGMIDPILATDDKNQDGYIDYPEFVLAQQAAQARGGSP